MFLSKLYLIDRVQSYFLTGFRIPFCLKNLTMKGVDARVMLILTGANTLCNA